MFAKSLFIVSSLVLIASQIECDNGNPEKVTVLRSKRGIDIDSLQPVGYNAHVSQPQTDAFDYNQQQQLDPTSYYNQKQQQQQLDPTSYYQQQQLDSSFYYQQPTEYPSTNMNGYQYPVDPSQYQPVGFNAGIMSSEQMHNAGDDGSRGNGFTGGLSPGAGGFSNGLGAF
ncbi:uncharacterized protein LOC141853417 [Brevipalpus obovatus]|uniref:uncharacterized protein LOC141853417 n=1 Tax=Brevipalpus obovatus TaxID=246614 RepID=UPI003D9E263A